MRPSEIKQQGSNILTKNGIEKKDFTFGADGKSVVLTSSGSEQMRPAIKRELQALGVSIVESD